MPLIQIETNLKDEDIPANFVVNLHESLAPVMGKDISKLITNLKTNQRMIVGASNVTPIILFRCWSFSVFDNLEKRNEINTFIYKYLKGSFPNLSYEQLKVCLHDMPPEDIGAKPSN